MLALIKLWITFSILMYIKCVIFVQHFEMGVGALQISIIIIIYMYLLIILLFFIFLCLELCNLIELM